VSQRPSQVAGGGLSELVDIVRMDLQGLGEGDNTLNFDGVEPTVRQRHDCQATTGIVAQRRAAQRVRESMWRHFGQMRQLGWLFRAEQVEAGGGDTGAIGLRQLAPRRSSS